MHIQTNTARGHLPVAGFTRFAISRGGKNVWTVSYQFLGGVICLLIFGTSSTFLTSKLDTDLYPWIVWWERNVPMYFCIFHRWTLKCSSALDSKRKALSAYQKGFSKKIYLFPPNQEYVCTYLLNLILHKIEGFLDPWFVWWERNVPMYFCIFHHWTLKCSSALDSKRKARSAY